MRKRNPSSKKNLAEENEILWRKLETVYDALGEMFDVDYEEGAADED